MNDTVVLIILIIALHIVFIVIHVWPTLLFIRGVSLFNQVKPIEIGSHLQRWPGQEVCTHPLSDRKMTSWERLLLLMTILNGSSKHSTGRHWSLWRPHAATKKKRNGIWKKRNTAEILWLRKCSTTSVCYESIAVQTAVYFQFSLNIIHTNLNERRTEGNKKCILCCLQA